MTETEKLKLLKRCLENRTPILYVGAGFSYGSINQYKIEIPLASGLCEKIYNYFWVENIFDEINDEKIKSIAFKYSKQFDLKKLCQIFRTVNMQNERDNYFSYLFKKCKILENDIRNAICQYPWSKIFTVNIDDLIENIYLSNDKKLNVWNRDDDNKRHFPDAPTLIKLHGCVNNQAGGFVFDEDEYRDCLTNQDYIITEFADSFSKNDVIFIGTEFQEEDLKSIVHSYVKKGYNISSVNNYFFIVPTINDTLFEMEIGKNSNMHHIKMNAAEFCQFLKDEIEVKDETYNKLIEYGLVDVHKIYAKLLSSYSSELYYGADILYEDLRDNWDVTDSQGDLMDWVKKDDSNKMIALHGIDYVGKTCMAKRLLYSFFILDYECYEFKLDSSDKIDLFMSLADKSEKNIAVLYEGAAYLYEILVDKIINDNACKKRIILITTDSTYNHNKKHYSLQKNSSCKELVVSEKINATRAGLIYEKLTEKHSLSFLNNLGEKEKIIKYIIDSNDIIDVLYFSSRGRGFEQHISTFILSDLNNEICIKKQIGIFCFLNKLGITYVPKYLFAEASQNINPAFDPKVFYKKASKIIQDDNKCYHLRYTRYLSSVFENILDDNEKKTVFKTLIKNVAGRFKEGEYNDHSSILYKLLNLRSLRLIFSIHHIKLLYQDIEKQCEEYSYYWVQRGLCAQKQESPEFEEADRFLREATIIRPASYQVLHAVAKNSIERGLYSLNKNSCYSSYFFEGMEKMQKLIENKRYDKALSYSLHSYISSWLKYCDCKSYTLNDDECATINSYIKKIKKEECDLSLHKVLYHLKFYALEKGIKNKLINVTNEFWKNPVQVDDIESIVESDWIF